MALYGRQLLRVDEAAEYLGMSRTTAYRLVAKGEIPTKRLGRRILVSKGWLERYLEVAPGSIEVSA